MIRRCPSQPSSRLDAFVSHILVTDGEQRSSLAIVRSLGRAGRDVSVCSAIERPLAGASRHCRNAFRVTDAAADPEGFREDLRALTERHGIDLVIPTTDVSALPLMALRTEESKVSIAFPDERAYHAVSDKRRLMEVARELGVAVPDQVVLESPTADAGPARELARRLGFDVVLKPARSAVLAAHSLSRFGVRLVSSEADLHSALAAYPPAAYPMLVQERISGPGLGAFVLAHDGDPVASFAHRRIREKPPTGGVSVYRESVPLKEEVRRGAEAILRHHGWTGVAMVEFKEDLRTGVPYLMEVNGRFWGSLQLAIDAGVDFPELLVELTEGKLVRQPISYTLGVRSRWLWGDVDHLLWVLRRGPAYRAAFPEIPSRLRALARFMIPWRPGDRFEILRLSDPRPFARESVEWLAKASGRRAGQRKPSLVSGAPKS